MIEATFVRLAALPIPMVGKAVAFKTPGGAGAIGRGAGVMEEALPADDGMLGFNAKDCRKMSLLLFCLRY